MHAEPESGEDMLCQHFTSAAFGNEDMGRRRWLG